MSFVPTEPPDFMIQLWRLCGDTEDVIKKKTEGYKVAAAAAAEAAANTEKQTKLNEVRKALELSSVALSGKVKAENAVISARAKYEADPGPATASKLEAANKNLEKANALFANAKEVETDIEARFKISLVEVKLLKGYGSTLESILGNS